MISLQTLAIILVVHFLADFALQTNEQATEKSTNPIQLRNHCATYSAVWLLISFGLLGTWWKPLIFGVVTYVTHFFIDANTSVIVKRLFEKKDYHNAFVMIGADQVMHYTQLLLTFVILN